MTVLLPLSIDKSTLGGHDHALFPVIVGDGIFRILWKTRPPIEEKIGLFDGK